MCILFVHLDENPSPGGYRLIIANNRDESWKRPTKPVGFWESNRDCISSLDLEPGREGGTWLAFSRNGRLGSLLSILAFRDPKKRGRGYLATHFLTSDKDMKSYLQDVATEADEYNNFNLVLADLRCKCMHNSGELCYRLSYGPEMPTDMALGAFSNSIGYVNSKTKCPQILNSGTYVFSNSPLETPWQKVVHNRAKFSDLVRQYGVKSQKNNLVASLLSILKDKTGYPDDQLVRTQGIEDGLTDAQIVERSATFVWSPSICFATITSSVILVDSDGNCEYIEHNMKTPPDQDVLEWTSDSIPFTLLK